MTSTTQNLFSFVSTLAGVQRFSLLKQVHKENCLEHTGMVAIFAFVIAKRILDRETHYGEMATSTLSLAEVLSKAIVHDWDETVTGDVVRPTKYFSKVLREEMRLAEVAGVQKIEAALSVPYLSTLHSEAKDGPAGYIVAFADLLAAVQHIWEEVLVSHNHHMAPAAHNTRKVFAALNADRPAATHSYHRVLDEYYEEASEMLLAVCAVKSQYVETKL